MFVVKRSSVNDISAVSLVKDVSEEEGLPASFGAVLAITFRDEDVKDRIGGVVHKKILACVTGG